MHLLIVVTLDLAVDPVNEDDPEETAKTDADTDDDVPTLVALHCDRGGSSRMSAASKRVGWIDLGRELSGNAGLIVQRASGRLDVARKGVDEV
jgi:hypothetical protein